MSERILKDGLIALRVNSELLADFDLVAKSKGRKRSNHLTEIMIREVKREHRNNPAIFKS